MPRFRVKVQDPASSHSADIEAADTAAASAEAQRALGDMAKDNLPNGDRFRMKALVEDDSGSEVFRASLEYKSQRPSQMAQPRPRRSTR